MNGWPTSRAFGDPDLTPDNFSSFSKQEISADTAAKGLAQLEPFPPATSTTPMDLWSVIGANLVQKIQNAGKITFHTVGDTGGIHSPQFQFAVADAMAQDFASSGASFYYHLGDVVYYFGQEQYYFEQFYDPYRNYNGPIFAIPGNHDGAVYTGEPGDTTDDASIAWPASRAHFRAGTLTITQTAPGGRCEGANFDPMIVADGIAPTDDPVLLFRSPVYANTFVRQLSQAITSAPASSFAHR